MLNFEHHMLTTTMVLEKIIRKSPFISEILNENLINYSALARRLRAEVEKELMKKVKTGAIIMSLKRLSKKIKSKQSIMQVLHHTPDMIVKSNLAEYTFSNSTSLIKSYRMLLMEIDTESQYFLTFTQGIFETTIITSRELKDTIKNIFKSEKVIAKYDNLSSITIKYSEEIVETPGVYYLILKTLAWEDINIIEFVSTYTEFTIVLDNRDLERAFSVLKGLFQQKA